MTSTTRLSSYSQAGFTFDVVDEGPLDGDPVVLLHGFPERASSWRLVAPLLHEHGLRTYAPDQRGYSPRARPMRRRDYRIGRLVEDVVALVDTIGRPVHLVGHDWGSGVAWMTAAARPDLVRTLTAVSVPHPLAFMRAILTSRQFRKSWYMAAFNIPRLPERLLAAPRMEVEFRKGGMSAEDVARYRTDIVEYGALPGALAYYRAIPLGDWTRRQSTIRVPTTFVWSDKDVAVGPEGGEHNHRYLAAPYDAVTLRGVSHWIPTEAPRDLADAILARIESAAGR